MEDNSQVDLQVINAIERLKDNILNQINKLSIANETITLLKDQNNELVEFKEKFEDLSNCSKDLNDDLLEDYNELETKVSRLDEENKILKNELEETKVKLENLDTLAHEYNILTEKYDKETKEFEIAINEFEIRKSQLQKDIDYVKNETQRKNDIIFQNEKTIKDLKLKIAEKDNEIYHLHNNPIKEKDLDELERVKQESELHIKKIKELKELTKSLQNEHENQIQFLNLEIERKTKTIENYENTRVSVKEAEERLEQNNRKLLDENQKLRTIIDELNHKISEIDKPEKFNDDLFSTPSKQILFLEKKVEERNEKLKQFQAEKKNLLLALDDKEYEIKRLHDLIDEKLKEQKNQEKEKEKIIIKLETYLKAVEKMIDN